jgi:hypothetical protein
MVLQECKLIILEEVDLRFRTQINSNRTSQTLSLKKVNSQYIILKYQHSPQRLLKLLISLVIVMNTFNKIIRNNKYFNSVQKFNMEVLKKWKRVDQKALKEKIQKKNPQQTKMTEMDP